MTMPRRCHAAGLMLVLTFLIPCPVQADGTVSQRALDRGHDFLKAAKRGRHILGYMHAGTKYVGHRYKEWRFVNDGEGKRVDGHFALVYAFDWNEDGSTDVAFLCDRRGNVYKVEVIESNALINQPFGIANATIKILGNLLIEAFKDKMTMDEKRQVQKAVDDADAKRLLELSLKIQQTLEK